MEYISLDAIGNPQVKLVRSTAGTTYICIHPFIITVALTQF